MASWPIMVAAHGLGTTEFFANAVTDTALLSDITEIHVVEVDLPYSEIFQIMSDAGIKTSRYLFKAQDKLSASLNAYFAEDYTTARDRVAVFKDYVSEHTEIRHGFPQYESDLVLAHADLLIIELDRLAHLASE